MWLWVKGNGHKKETKAVEVWLMSLEWGTKKGSGKDKCGCEAKDRAQREDQCSGNAVVKRGNRGLGAAQARWNVVLAQIEQGR